MAAHIGIEPITSRVIDEVSASLTSTWKSRSENPERRLSITAALKLLSYVANFAEWRRGAGYPTQEPVHTGKEVKPKQ